MRVRLLGPVEVGSGEARPSPRDRMVLAALAVHAGRFLSATTIGEALWSDGPPASAAKVVQGCVSRLRASWGRSAIETRRGVPARRYSRRVDRDGFESLAARGHELLRGRWPERAAARSAGAGALAGTPPRRAGRVGPRTARGGPAGGAATAAEEDLLQARLDAGDHRRGGRRGASSWWESEPWRERRWALLALAQYRCGRQADALASIRRPAGCSAGARPRPGIELVELERGHPLPGPCAGGRSRGARRQQRLPVARAWRPTTARTATASSARADGRGLCLEPPAGPSPCSSSPGRRDCGKSSLMSAGWRPRCAPGPEVAVFSPGTAIRPRWRWRRTLAADGSRPLVDQFEEPFAGADPGPSPLAT